MKMNIIAQNEEKSGFHYHYASQMGHRNLQTSYMSNLQHELDFSMLFSSKSYKEQNH